MKMEIKKNNLQKIMSLLKNAEGDEYIGESVTQLEHALQCAYFAQKSGATSAIVVSALLHDVGHLLADENTQSMDGLGVMNHEVFGGEYLRKLGFDEYIIDLVQNHVHAKRYLCYKRKTYGRQLSIASKGTLAFQGGPMDENEALSFEAHPNFEARIQVRLFDEMGKKVDFPVPSLDTYKDLLLKHIIH